MAQGLNALCYVADDIVWGLPCFSKSSLLSQSSGTDSVAAGDLQGRPTLELILVVLVLVQTLHYLHHFQDRKDLGGWECFFE